MYRGIRYYCTGCNVYAPDLPHTSAGVHRGTPGGEGHVSAVWCRTTAGGMCRLPLACTPRGRVAWASSRAVPRCRELRARLHVYMGACRGRAGIGRFIGPGWPGRPRPPRRRAMHGQACYTCDVKQACLLTWSSGACHRRPWPECRLRLGSHAEQPSGHKRTHARTMHLCAGRSCSGRLAATSPNPNPNPNPQEGRARPG